MSTKLRVISMLAGILLLFNSGCTSGSRGAAGGSNTEVTPLKPAPTQRVFFDNIAQIPLGAKDSTVLIRIHNDFASQLVLKSVKVINPSTNKEDNKLATINSSGCSLVPAANSCSIAITPHLQHSGSFILEASLAANNGKIHNLRQLIRVSDQVKDNNEIAFTNDFTRMASVDGRYNLAFPVLLSEKFDEVKVRNGNLICNGSYSPGSLCTYFVDGKVSQDNTLIGLSVTGYKGDMAIASNKSSILYTLAADEEAHLLISQPKDIEVDNFGFLIGGDTEITIFNNGLRAATNLSIQVNDSNNALSLVDGCKDRLTVGDTCTFKVRAQTDKHGVGSVIVKYLANEKQTQLTTAIVNVYYNKDTAPNNLQYTWATEDEGLFNTLIGETATQDLIVLNASSEASHGIAYNLEAATTELSLSGVALPPISPKPCDSLTVLGVARVCSLRIKYTPTQVTNGEQQEDLYLRANYSKPNEQMRTLLTQIPFTYSAVDPRTMSPLQVAIPAGLDKIIVNAGETRKETIIFRNISNRPTVLGEIALNPADSKLLLDDPVSLTRCHAGLTLEPSSECGIMVSYTGVAGHSNRYKLQLNLASYGGFANTSKYPVIINTRTLNYTPAQVSVTMDTQQPLPANTTPDPHVANKYKVYSWLTNETLKLNYTFRFSGGDSYDFNVSSSGLPIGAHILNDSIDNKHNICPTGIEHANYLAGETCVVVVEVPKLSLIEGNASNILPNSLITPVLHYSWRDNGKDGVNVNSRSTADDGLNPQIEVISSWLNDFNITTTDFELAADPTVVEAVITVGFKSPTMPINFSYPLTVTAQIWVLEDGEFDIKEERCQIRDAAAQQCQLTVAIDKDAANGEYHYLLFVRDSRSGRHHKETVTIHKKP